ncbi:hypothetical protein V1477_003244 [Vespula maculifrons]|uniref:Uncharacterized protein n=1 Tax=Vespula maculifrons TaxID=7453 RepID=A0ABD2CTZ0_VESMC
MCENKYIYINSSLLLVENVYWENCDAYSSKFEARLNQKLEKMCENKYIYINSSLLLVENVYWENCDAYSSKFEARLNQ